ncbi:cell division protein ZapA [Clostridiaceae bacterium Marseille-Q4145]|jgi:cell division protein ZapA|nr:cell division protein ZapA [Clostridiaceae bacterium Marseille-Q4145]
MAKKNTAEVLINGKIYTISGYESTAYLQKVAVYLNEMEDKVSQMEGYRRLGSEEKQLLKNMNLADEYFKAYDAKEQLEKELENREKEIYSLKHDLIDARMEKDNLMKRIQELEGELQNEKKQLKQSASVRKLHKPEQKL